MAVFEYKNNKVNYIIEGSGKPLLLLNGIMMTCASWEPVAQGLRIDNTLIRLDLLDQGLTSKQKDEYLITDQAELVAAFIKYLGYENINIVGISYGGYVGLDLATKYPSLVDRMIIFNSSADVDAREEEMFKQFKHVARLDDAYAFYLTTIPLFYSPTFYESRKEWMKNREALLVNVFENKDYRESIYRLANSCINHDVRSELNKITAQTLIVSADEDYLIPLPKQQFLNQNIKNSYLVTMGKTGHVSVYENPILFTSLIYGFINNPNLKFNI